jgi:YD repeat-containing protein
LQAIDLYRVKTNYAFNDPLDRLTQIQAAATTGVEAQSNVTYTGANQVDVYRSQGSASDNALHSETLYDGLGRVRESIQYENGGSSIATSKAYDALGRLSSTSNPYRPGGGAWGGLYYTTYLYDALGRITLVTTPDGATVGTSYSANLNGTPTGTQTTVTDQAGKQRTTTTDGLGRITAVAEDPSGLNYQTVYGYSALDDLTCVNQGAIGSGGVCQAGLAHARSFSYDSLKRLTLAANPESGATSYSYDKVGNLLTKTDARFETCFGNLAGNSCDGTGYDALNRPILKSFTDVHTPPVTYIYDAAPSGAPIVSECRWAADAGRKQRFDYEHSGLR